jgi:hypothetical protein
VKVVEYLYKEEFETAPIPPGQTVESFLKSELFFPTKEHTPF